MASSRPKHAAKKAPASRAKAKAKAPEPGILSRHAVDLTAIGLGTLTLLLVLAIWFNTLGPVGRALNTGLADLFGQERYLLPLLTGFAASMLFVNREDVELRRIWIGGAIALGAVSGLFGLSGGRPSLSAPTQELRAAGGYLGALIGHTLAAGVGGLGAAIILLVALFVSLVLITGLPLKVLGQKLGASVSWMASMARRWWTGGDLSDKVKEAWVEPVREQRRAAEVPDGFVVADPDDLEAFDFDEPELLVEPGGIYDQDRDLEEVGERSTPLVPDEEPAAFVGASEVPAADTAVTSSRTTSRGNKKKTWKLPSLSILQRSQILKHDQRAVEAAGQQLVAALASHGVETTLVGFTVGPTVTRYELELGPAVKVAKVTGLSKDIAYAMASPDVRILAPIPGRSAIGVEVPNRQRQLVSLGDLLSSKEAKSDPNPLSVAIGRDIAGRTVMEPLSGFPHLLISGATGAGKSSAINSLITSILMRATPDQVRLILIDPKRVELGQYNGLPHLLTPVVVDPRLAANALAWAVKEMERRYDLLASHGVRDITSYMQARTAGQLKPQGKPDDSAAIEAIAEKARLAARGEDTDHIEVETVEEVEDLPYVVIIVDELNDLMMVAARDVEESVVRIAQMARAVGIHLVLATQRPSVNVITGVIKANIPSRMAFSVSSLADSRVILDQQGAERLIGKGDMLLLTASSNVPRRIQAPWVSEEEVREVVAYWRSLGGETESVVSLVGPSAGEQGSLFGSGGAGGDDDDELLAQARRIVIETQLGSTSMLQRKLRVGFARAGRLMDLLEQQGVVGPSTGSKAREVLVVSEEPID